MLPEREDLDDYGWLTYEDDCTFFPIKGMCNKKNCANYDNCYVRLVEEARGRKYDVICI